MRQANASIIREIPLFPTVGKTLYNMKSSVVFNKLNLRIWYYWIKLEESSMESLYTKAFTDMKDWLLINVRNISANGFTNVSWFQNISLFMVIAKHNLMNDFVKIT